MLKMKRKKNGWCLNPIQVVCFWTFSPWKTLSGLFLPACCYYHVGIHLPCDIHIFKGESTAWMVIISFHFDDTEMAKPVSASGPSSKDNTLLSICFPPTPKAHLQNLTQGNSQGVSPCLPTSFSHFIETQANIAWSYFSFFSCLLNLILKHGPQENYDLG